MTLTEYYSCSYRESNCSRPVVAPTYRNIVLLNTNMNSLAEDLQLKQASWQCLCSTFSSPLHFLIGRLQVLRISREWPKETLKTICHDHDFYLQFEINCDKAQMRPYNFLLARPSFVLRWQPAYAGREFRSTSIFPTERDSDSDFKLRQEDSVTDRSFEFQCDVSPSKKSWWST